VEYCDKLLAELGLIQDVTYKEEPWSGGGNAGPCLEVTVAGLELATLVFMNLRESDDGNLTIKGKRYAKMDNYIVDTGYGLERFVWASKGSPTVYDAVFPDIVNTVMEHAGIEHSKVLAQNARLSGLFDLSTVTDLERLRTTVAKEIGIDVERLKSTIEPDGIVPSNAKAGYLARLVTRRMLRQMDGLNLDLPLSELVEMQMLSIGDQSYMHRMDTIREILDWKRRNIDRPFQRAGGFWSVRLRSSRIRERFQYRS